MPEALKSCICPYFLFSYYEPFPKLTIDTMGRVLVII